MAPQSVIMPLRALVLWITGLSLCQARVHAQFRLVSESAVSDPQTHAVTFTIAFNQPPDFFTLDMDSIPANSFQYFIFGDQSLPYPGYFDAIIRGDEIHLAGALRVRNAAPSSSDPSSGGWGSVRGTVPYTLTGDRLAFTTPLSLISDHSLDGLFSYQVESYEFGTTTQSVIGNSSLVVPEPGPLALFACAGISGFALLRRRRQHL